ncbi:MAG: hypothetical protein QME81_03175 [bacterium]|nr:hypothetical protein [bacterium]
MTRDKGQGTRDDEGRERSVIFCVLYVLYVLYVFCSCGKIGLVAAGEAAL